MISCTSQNVRRDFFLWGVLLPKVRLFLWYEQSQARELWAQCLFPSIVEQNCFNHTISCGPLREDRHLLHRVGGEGSVNIHRALIRVWKNRGLSPPFKSCWVRWWKKSNIYNSYAYMTRYHTLRYTLKKRRFLQGVFYQVIIDQLVIKKPYRTYSVPQRLRSVP